MPGDPQGLFYAGAFVALAGLSAVVLWRHQLIALWTFLIWVVLDGTRWVTGAEPVTQSFALQIAGVSIYPQDAFTVLFLAAGLVRMPARRLRPSGAALLALFGVLVVARLLTLSAAFSPVSAVNLSRPYLLILGVILWSATTPRAWVPRDTAALVGSALLAVVMASLAMVRYGIGSSSAVEVVDGTQVGARPTSAAVALLVVLALVSVVSGVAPVGRWRVPLGVIFAATILLLQHRSAWVSTIVAGLALIATYIWVSRARRAGVWITALVVAAATLPLALLVTGRSAVLRQSATAEGTWLWRLDRWRTGLDAKHGWSDWLVGQVLVTDRIRTDIPSSHSLYVDAMVSLGVAGAAALLGLWLVTLTRVRASSVDLRQKLLIAGWVLGCLAFGVTYQLPAFAYVLVGVALAVPRSPSREDQGDASLYRPATVGRRWS